MASSSCAGGLYRHTGGPPKGPRGSRMKVTVDVDCTPEEARRFLGLPDLSPVHAAYVEKLKSAVTDGPTPELFGDMMKAWGPMNEAGMNMRKQMLHGLS